jgi:hypothetical protein
MRIDKVLIFADVLSGYLASSIGVPRLPLILYFLGTDKIIWG